MNGFSEKKSRAALFNEEGENICPANKIVQNAFLTQKHC